MELILKFKEFLLFFLCLWQHSNAMSLEPKYSKFEFLDQMLEKVVRVELYAESIEKLMLKSMKSINEISNNTNVELSKMTEKLDTFKAEMEHFQTNMTTWNDIKLDEFKKQSRDFAAEIRSDLDKHTGTATVAFNVYRESTISQTLGTTEPVVFDQIRLNTCGNCYSTTTGVFTAPVGGIYQFNSQLCADKGGDLEYRLVVNDVIAIEGEYRTASDADDTKCTSFSVVSQVDKGHTVSVRGYNHPLKAKSDDELSFSGVLIKPI